VSIVMQTPSVCEACADLVTDDFSAEAWIVAERRGVDMVEAIQFVLWWFHEAGHPRGNWMPTGVVDMPAIHST
jgi:hypothetical protein